MVAPARRVLRGAGVCVGGLSASLVPQVALACAVCGDNGRNADAYLDMTIFMSLLPLSIIGGISFAVWRLSRVA